MDGALRAAFLAVDDNMRTEKVQHLHVYETSTATLLHFGDSYILHWHLFSEEERCRLERDSTAFDACMRTFVYSNVER